MDDKLPLISVITVSYNAVSTIENTLLSVINQSYANIEYIVIDGGSTDGTVDVIKKYKDRIAYWVSEVDRGIYDAMNKGIQVATGEWINFMNCGDYFYNNDIITTITPYFSDKTDVIYGDVMAGKGGGFFHFKSGNIHGIKKNLPFCHQAAFCKRSQFLKYKFDLSFSLCADYDFFYRIYNERASFYRLSIIISFFDATHGVSSVNRDLLLSEISRISGRSLWLLKLEYLLKDIRFLLLRKNN